MRISLWIFLILQIFPEYLSAQKNEFTLADHISYSVRIHSLKGVHDSLQSNHAFPYSSCSMDSALHSNFIKNIFDVVYKGKIKSYNYPFWEKETLYKIPKTIQELRSEFLFIDTSFTSDGNDIKITTDSIKTFEITHLGFDEQWIYNDIKFIFEKKSRGIYPVREYESVNIPGQYLLNPLFMICTDSMRNKSINKNKKKSKLIERIVTYTKINNEDNMNLWNILPSSMNYSMRIPLFKSLINAVKTGKLKAYSDDQLKHKINKNDISKILNIQSMDKAMDTLIQKEICAADIVALGFIEEWQYNPETYDVIKKVIGIAPIGRKKDIENLCFQYVTGSKDEITYKKDSYGNEQYDEYGSPIIESKKTIPIKIKEYKSMDGKPICDELKPLFWIKLK